jgi:chorismate dehydratase
MTPVRLGAVGYLNARPMVFGLEQSPLFTVRYDVPSECVRLLHAGDIDIGLVSSIEYLRGDDYRIVPDLAITSRGPVLSVALYTARPIRDVRSIVMDTSSRTSVALVRVLCARLFRIEPVITSSGPDLSAMLTEGDAALIIGDNALLWDPADVQLKPDATSTQRSIEKIDLGEAWTGLTGLPFVWALWAGRAGALGSKEVAALRAARDAGAAQPEAIARAFFQDAAEQALGARYLRDNIKYHLGPDERAGLEAFYHYAGEIGIAPAFEVGQALRFY